MVYIAYFKNKNSDMFRVDLYFNNTFVSSIYCSKMSFVDEINTVFLYDKDQNLIASIHKDRTVETNHTWTEKDW